MKPTAALLEFSLPLYFLAVIALTIRSSEPPAYQRRA